MKPSPLVSVCIASYNHEKYIGETITSVIAQSYANWELIVVDDRSSDRSLEILRYIAGQYPNQIKLIELTENLGPSGALNKAIGEAKGEYVALLGSDDRMHVDRLKKQVDYLNTHVEVSTVFTKVAAIDAAGNSLGEGFPAFDVPITDIRTQLLQGNFLNAPSVMGRKDVWLEAGLHNNALRYVQDYDLWLHILDNHEISRLDERLTEYRIHGDNLSMNKPQDFAFARHYETAICKLNAIQRWTLERMRLIPDDAGGNVSESDIASAKCAMAKFCLNIDHAHFQKPFLGTAQAYHYALEAVKIAPHMNIVQDVMNEVYSALGDQQRTFKHPEKTESSMLNSVSTAVKVSQQSMCPSVHFIVIDIYADPKPVIDSISSVLHQQYNKWGMSVLSSKQAITEEFNSEPNLEWIQTNNLEEELNKLIEKSPSDWMNFLFSGDQLETDYLISMLELVNTRKELNVIYSNTDSINDAGDCYSPNLKTEININHFRESDHIGNACLLKTTAVKSNINAVSLSHYDFIYGVLLKIFESNNTSAFAYNDAIFFHRYDGGMNPESMPISAEKRKEYLEQHLSRCGITA